YFTNYFEKRLNTTFIYKVMEKKFDYRSINIWNMKLCLFTMFYIYVIKKARANLPHYSVRDMENFNPLHRLLITNVIKEKIISSNSLLNTKDEVNLLENTFNLIEKLNNVKDKNKI